MNKTEYTVERISPYDRTFETYEEAEDYAKRDVITYADGARIQKTVAIVKPEATVPMAITKLN